jgi:hypothetical protein
VAEVATACASREPISLASFTSSMA